MRWKEGKKRATTCDQFNRLLPLKWRETSDSIMIFDEKIKMLRIQMNETQFNGFRWFSHFRTIEITVAIYWESNSYHWPSLLCTSNSYLLNWSTVIHTLQRSSTHTDTRIYIEKQETRLNQIRLHIKCFFLLLFRVFIIRFLEFYSQTAIWCFACHLMKKKLSAEMYSCT